MRRYLLDSGPLTDYIHRREPVFSQAIDRIRKGDRIGICPPIFGEIYGGILGSTNPERNMQRLLQYLPSLRMWPYDVNAAEEYGRLIAYLRQIGRPMQQVDIQLAAVALSLTKTIVVTTDSDLQAIPDLEIEDWSKFDSKQ